MTGLRSSLHMFPSHSLSTRLLHMPCSYYSTAAWDTVVSSSDPLTQQKSAFRAFATGVPTYHPADHPNHSVSSWMKADVLPRVLANIEDLEPRTRRASHVMYAWRVHAAAATRSSSPHSVYFGSSNGGEAGAGERLERLLELGKCEDVMLVVLRWYGGVKLGADRWRCISSVAKEALHRGGFLDDTRPPDSSRRRTGRK